LPTEYGIAGWPGIVADVDQRDWPATLDEVIGAVATASDTYWAAVEAKARAGDHLETSVVSCRLYLVWAALTDRYELKPNERPDALDQMRQASREWIAAVDNPETRDDYLDHWQYTVLGYERNPPKLP
jgi:hypothetical protein